MLLLDEDSVLFFVVVIMMRYGYKDKWYKRVLYQVKGVFISKKRIKRFIKFVENFNKINKEVMIKLFLFGFLLSLFGMYKREWFDIEFSIDDEDFEKDDDSCQGIFLLESDKVIENDFVL